MRILFALLSLLVGVFLLFGGYRLARFLIPLMGFIFGLSVGGAVMADIAGTAFLATAASIIVGILTGLVFGALAYLYYYLAVVVMAGGLGYWAGSGFVLLLGFSPGLLSALIGIALGIVVGLLAIFSNAPKYLLILLTALAGATASLGGILLLFNKIPLDTFSYTTVSASLRSSFFWSMVGLALVIVGSIAQVRYSTGTYEYDLDEWGVDHTGHAPPASKPHASGTS